MSRSTFLGGGVASVGADKKKMKKKRCGEIFYGLAAVLLSYFGGAEACAMHAGNEVDMIVERSQI